MDSIYMESSCQTPIVLMYAEESETVRRYYIHYARSKVGSSSYSIVDINQLGLLTEDKQIKRILSKPMEDVNILIEVSGRHIAILLNLKLRAIGYCFTIVIIHKIFYFKSRR